MDTTINQVPTKLRILATDNYNVVAVQYEAESPISAPGLIDLLRETALSLEKEMLNAATLQGKNESSAAGAGSIEASFSEVGTDPSQTNGSS